MSPRSTAPRTTILARGRAAFDRQAWADAHALLSEADREEPIGLEDLERLAIAAHLIGEYAESAALSVRSYQEAVRAGDIGRAARSAFWVAVEHLGYGEMAPAAGLLGGVGRDAAHLARHMEGASRMILDESGAAIAAHS